MGDLLSGRENELRGPKSIAVVHVKFGSTADRREGRIQRTHFRANGDAEIPTGQPIPLLDTLG